VRASSPVQQGPGRAQDGGYTVPRTTSRSSGSRWPYIIAVLTDRPTIGSRYSEVSRAVWEYFARP
jgi:hypothetical protein